ncbi:hypothetical protein D3C87_1508930 [compost metagenome]
MRRAQEARQATHLVVERKRLFREDVAGRNDVPAFDGRHQRIEVDDAGAAEQDEGGTRAHAGKSLRAEKALVLAGDRCDHKDEIAFCHHCFERCRFHAIVPEDRGRHPGIENADPGAEAG